MSKTHIIGRVETINKDTVKTVLLSSGRLDGVSPYVVDALAQIIEGESLFFVDREYKYTRFIYKIYEENLDIAIEILKEDMRTLT